MGLIRHKVNSSGFKKASQVLNQVLSRLFFHLDKKSAVLDTKTFYFHWKKSHEKEL